MSLKSIIQKAAISSLLATAPMPATGQEIAQESSKRAEITRQMDEFLDSPIEYNNPLANLETVIEDPASEPVLEMPELTKKFMGYYMTEDEYSQVQKYIGSKKLNKNDKEEIKSYIGFISVMRHERLINFVASYYSIDPMSIFDVMNQESAFQIRAIGPFKERGLGQHKMEKAKFLMQEVTNPESELYYPFIDIKGYEFSKLSRDYHLDIIMIAAGIKIANDNLDNALEENSMTRKDLADKIKEVGSSTRFSYLKKGDNEDFKFYTINKRFIKRMNSLWKSSDIDEGDLTYMAYNGGKDCVRNFLRKRIISEVILINLTNYSRRKYIVSKFIGMYYNLNDEDTNQ